MVLDGEGENRIHLNRDDPRVIRYLKGETLDVSDLDLEKEKRLAVSLQRRNIRLAGENLPAEV